MNGNYYRGEVYYITPNEPTTGCEIHSDRPGLIISNDVYNRCSGTVVIAYLTTREKRPLRTHVVINSTGVQATVLCEQIFTVDKSRLDGYKGTLTESEMLAVEEAIRIGFGLPENDIPASPVKKDEVAIIKATVERDVYKELYTDLLEGLKGGGKA